MAGDRCGTARLARHRPPSRYRVADPDGLLPSIDATGSRSDRPLRSVALAGVASLRPGLDARLAGLNDAAGRAPGDHRVLPLRGVGPDGETEAGGTPVHEILVARRATARPHPALDHDDGRRLRGVPRDRGRLPHV